MAYTYSKLAEITVGAGGASTITFNNIPQNYTDLVLKVSARGTVVRASTGYYYQLTLNGTTTNQSTRYINGNGSTATSSTFARLYGYCVPSDDTANTFSSNDYYFTNYSGSTNKSVSFDGLNENNGTATDSVILSGLWSVPTAISSLIMTPAGGSFAQYSTAYLYGIRVEL